MKTNEEFISELMNFSPYGRLTQVFVIEAIRYYSELVGNTPKPFAPGNHIISQIAWWEIANFVNDQVNQNYPATE